MTTIAKGSALVFGAFLYVVEERLLGYLAATTVPKGCFDFFGPHKVVALFLEEALLVALPAFLLALGWGLGATRLIRLSPDRVGSWLIAGLMIAWGGRLLHGVMALQVDPLPGQSSFTALLLSFIVPPVWGVLTSLSAPLGVFSAGLLGQRSDPALQRTALPPLN